MALVQNGQRDAFAELFARHKDPLWAFLVRRSGDPEAAADLYQESFLRVWRSAPTYNRDQPFKPWLYRVAINAARDRFRRSKREPEVVDVESIEASGVLAPEIPPTDLEKAIKSLPDALREAFVLGAVLGMDHNEVAGVLEITPDNARARISRARARLRELLVPAKGEA